MEIQKYKAQTESLNHQLELDKVNEKSLNEQLNILQDQHNKLKETHQSLVQQRLADQEFTNRLLENEKKKVEDYVNNLKKKLDRTTKEKEDQHSKLVETAKKYDMIKYQYEEKRRVNEDLTQKKNGLVAELEQMKETQE